VLSLRHAFFANGFHSLAFALPCRLSRHCAPPCACSLSAASPTRHFASWKASWADPLTSLRFALVPTANSASMRDQDQASPFFPSLLLPFPLPPLAIHRHPPSCGSSMGRQSARFGPLHIVFHATAALTGRAASLWGARCPGSAWNSGAPSTRDRQIKA